MLFHIYTIITNAGLTWPIGTCEPQQINPSNNFIFDIWWVNLPRVRTCILCLCCQISTNVLARQAHATEDRPASTQLAPTSARGTLLTVGGDTISTKTPPAALVQFKNPLLLHPKHRTNLPKFSSQCSLLFLWQTLMNARDLKRSVKGMVASTWWAPTAVNVRMGTSSTASAECVRVSSRFMSTNALKSSVSTECKWKLELIRSCSYNPEDLDFVF